MKLFLFLLSLLISTSLLAGIEVREFKDPALTKRYTELIDELRCLVCQNQNLAASNSELAQDLRRQVFEMLEAGKTDKQVTDFMVRRYGDFVLYRPPLKTTTLLLWGGPFVLLLLAVIVLIRFIRNRASQVPVSLSDEERRKVQDLLKKKDKE